MYFAKSAVDARSQMIGYIESLFCRWHGWSIGAFLFLLVAGVGCLMVSLQSAAAESVTDDRAGVHSRQVTPMLSIPGGVDAAAEVQPHKLLHDILARDPDVMAARSDACQALHRLHMVRGQARPQITGAITGNRQLIGRVKKEPSFFDRSSGAAEIRRAGAHTRDFNHDERNNIYDGKISLRYTLFDWGARSARHQSAALDYQAAVIQAEQVWADRLSEVMRLALNQWQADQTLALLRGTMPEVDALNGIIEDRVVAGVERMSVVRMARLLALDLDLQLEAANARRTGINRQIKTELAIETSNLGWLVALFRQNRAEGIIQSDARTVRRTRVLELQERAAKTQGEETAAKQYPSVTGVLNHTFFDLTDYEDEYELVGGLEFQMPLYDGGTARAQLREVQWRIDGIAAQRHRFFRTHNTSMTGVLTRFSALAEQHALVTSRLKEQILQMQGLQTRQGQVDVTLGQMAGLHVAIMNDEIELVAIEAERDLLRVEALLLADALSGIIGVPAEDAPC